MFDLMQSVEDRTNLAGTNRLEVLMFSLEDNKGDENKELFGINVFKVREMMAVPDILELPHSPACMRGVAHVRGESLPVIDLQRYCNIQDAPNPKIMVITEYNRTTQGFLVNDVENIIQLAWSDIREPPRMLLNNRANIITGSAKLPDGRMLMLLDVEKVLAEVLKVGRTEHFYDAAAENRLKGIKVVFCDDSAVARAQLEKILTMMEVEFTSAKNGADAWDLLLDLANNAEAAGRSVHDDVQLVITDVEMPEMDGYVLTRNIKADPRFNGIPVIMHSSLSADANQRLGKKVGADAYVPKLRPKDLSETICSLIGPC